MPEEAKEETLRLSDWSYETMIAAATELGIPVVEKEVPIPGTKKAQTVKFNEPRFELGEGTSQDRFTRLVAWFQKVQSDGDPLDLNGLCVSGRVDLKLRNLLGQQYKPIDPEAEIKKMAERLHKAKAGKISMEQAMERARAALE